MPRFFLSGGSSIAGGTAFILGEDAAHAKVLRLRVGDTMIVCDGGKDHHCTVTKITPNEVEAEIFEVVPCQGEPSVHTVILAGLPKGSDKTDYILQKCTEAGASEIYFFASSRCVARIQGDADKKIARWQRIAEEAAKQSGRGVIPSDSCPISRRPSTRRMPPRCPSLCTKPASAKRCARPWKVPEISPPPPFSRVRRAALNRLRRSLPAL